MSGNPPAWWKDTINEDSIAVLQGYRLHRGSIKSTDSALLVVDVVDSFVGPNAPVLSAQRYARTACGANAWRSLPKIQSLVEGYRDAERPIMFTVGSTDNDERKTGQRSKESRDSRPTNAAVHASIKPMPGEPVIPKTGPSAFHDTSLLSALSQSNISDLVIVGATTSGCVLASVIDAFSAGFRVCVVRDACFDRVDSLGEAALIMMDTRWANVTSAETVLDGLVSLEP